MSDAEPTNARNHMDANTADAKHTATCEITPIIELISALQIAGADLAQVSGKLAASQHFPSCRLLENIWLRDAVEAATRAVVAVNRYNDACKLASLVPAGSA